MKTIYLIRHGQTEFNQLGIVQGSGVDSSLNDTGRAQGNAFYEAYKHISFDKIYTSKLVRTKETVTDFMSHGIPMEALEGLNEINWGNKDGKVIANTSPDYKNAVAEWKKGNFDFRMPEGESPNEVVERQKVALDYILNQQEEEIILICMHGRAMRMLLCLLLELPLTEMDHFKHANVCLYQLKLEKDKFTVVKSNDQVHLNSLVENEG